MLKKLYYIVIVLIINTFFIFPVRADWEVVQMLDFGVIQNIARTVATLKMNKDGVVTGSGYSSIRDEHVGILKYTNTGSSSISVARTGSFTTTTLQCTSNCSNSTCTASLSGITSNPSTTATTVASGGSTQWNLYGTLRTTADCTGVYEGTFNITLKEGNQQITRSFTAKIIIGDIPSISVTPQDDLDFGDILSTTSSSVTVGTNGNRTCSPASVCVNSQSSNGSFTVTNSSSSAQTFTVDCPSGAVQMGSGSSNFYIDSFICSASSSTVSSGSPATINVGATLHVPQGQASGQYSTTYTITVNN